MGTALRTGLSIVELLSTVGTRPIRRRRLNDAFGEAAAWMRSPGRGLSKQGAVAIAAVKNGRLDPRKPRGVALKP